MSWGRWPLCPGVLAGDYAMMSDFRTVGGAVVML